MSISIQECKCKNCGNPLHLYLPYRNATCEYCGTNYYVEGNLDTNGSLNALSSVYGDNPIKVEVVRDEGTSELEIDDKVRIYGLYNYRSFFFPDFKYIIDRLQLISAIAFLLKKSYKLKDTYLSSQKYYGDSHIPYYVTSYSVVYGFNPGLLKDKNTKKRVEEIINSSKEYYTAQLTINRWKKYSINVDNRQGSVERYRLYVPWRNVISHEVCLDFSTYKPYLVYPIITPNYFTKYFSGLNSKYNMVKDKPIIGMIANGIIPYVAKKGFSFACDGCKVFVYCPKAIRFDFHQFGMDYTSDKMTINAISIAILERVLDGTKKEGLYMHDFVGLKNSDEFYGESPEMRLRNIGESVDYEIIKPYFEFKYLERINKKYGSW